MIYVRTCANRFCIFRFHLGRPIVNPIPRSSDINYRNRSSTIFPIFSHMKVPPILGLSSQTLTFYEPEAQVMAQNAFPPQSSHPSVERMIRAHHCDPCVKTCGLKKKIGPQTLPKGPKNHLSSSRFHTFLNHPLKSRSNPNPCTKTQIQLYGSKEGVNFKRDTPSNLGEHPQILA